MLRIDDHHSDFSVSRMTPLEFKSAIEKTEKWLKKNGKTLTLDPKTREWLKTVGKGPD